MDNLKQTLAAFERAVNCLEDKLFAGTSEGAIKGWESRRGMSGSDLDKAMPDNSATPEQLKETSPGHYHAIGMHLGGMAPGKDEDPKGYFSSRVVKAVGKLKPYGGAELLYRGLAFNSKEQRDSFLKSVESSGSFSSTTPLQSFSTSEKETSHGAGHGVTMVLEKHGSGKDVTPFTMKKSGNAGKEIVFLKGTKFKVSKVSMEGSHPRIHISEA